MPHLLSQRPRFEPTAASRFGREHFGIDAEATELTSERDQNFLLRGADGERWVLKLSNASERAELLELESAMLERLQDRAAPFRFPQVRPTDSGELTATVEDASGRTHLARLLSYVPGTLMAHSRPHASALLQQVGHLLGSVSRALDGFAHRAANRTLKWDLGRAPELIRDRLALIQVPQRRDLVTRLLAAYERHTMPLQADWRRSVIHNDANDHNVILGPLEMDASGWPRRQVTGLIDLGDALECWTVGELAVGVAYAMLGRQDPIAAAAAMTAGYHGVYPLAEPEIEAVVGLATARLCLSVCNSAEQRGQQPDNEYLSVSEEGAWAALERLDQVHPRLGQYRLRAACDLEPCPAAPVVRSWLEANLGSMAPIVEPALDEAYVFDLSVGSREMGGGAPGSFEAAEVTSNLFGRMRRAGAEVGLGRYDETRCWYGGDLFAAPADEAPRRRSLHLGIDIFLPPGAAVHAPLAGRIASAQLNAGRLDYGPTLMLEHEPEPGVRFWTLYGHLTPDSLDGWAEGDAVEAGRRIAAIGDYPDNGDWAPHLHFQVVVDRLGHKGDFPGVAAADERDVWLSLAPDPNLILNAPAEPLAVQRIETEELLQRRHDSLGPSLSISYRRPLHIVRGAAQFLYDRDGQPFLDAVNNVPHVGHSHPDVVAAAARQNAVLNTNTRYLHESILRYAERLTATLPEALSVAYLVCSGSEANELAIRMARAHTGRQDVVVLEGAYHGNTTTLIDLSPYKHDGPGGRGAPEWVQVAPLPDPYRGRREQPDAGAWFAAQVGAACARSATGVAAFMAEPLLGCGGQIVPPDDYLAAAFEHARNAGGVCIADEVQIGFGRVGTHMWAFENRGAVPDIVTLGKPIGNGHPLAAVVTTPEIAASFANGMEYFNTIGGNPVSCEVGMAVLDVIEHEQLQANAHAVGARLLDGLREIKSRHPLVGDVRGVGLYAGAELVSDPDTLAPAAEAADYVINRMRDHGILLSTDGPLHNVLKIKPPLCFSADDADRLLEVLDSVLGEDYPHAAYTG